MPELPEVETAMRGIQPYLQDAVIEKFIIRTPKLRWDIPERLSQLQNIKIEKLSRRAKYLIIHTEQGEIIIHLGMSGSLSIVKLTDLPQKHDHVDMQLNNGYVLRFNDPRRFGAYLWVGKTILEDGSAVSNLADFHLFQKLGFEPLDENFNAEYLFKKSRNRNIPVKSFIMDNSVVVGVGNIYANESLFLAQLHPLKLAKNLTRNQCKILVTVIKQEIQRAIQQGGTTLKDFIQPDGKPGYFAQELQVYGKKDQLCPRCNTEIEKCGTKIQSLVINQRNSYFCERCQRK